MNTAKWEKGEGVGIFKGMIIKKRHWDLGEEQSEKMEVEKQWKNGMINYRLHYLLEVGSRNLGGWNKRISDKLTKAERIQ